MKIGGRSFVGGLGLLYVTRGESWFQQGKASWTRASGVLPSVANWTLSAGGSFEEAPLTDFRLFGPGYPGGIVIPRFEEDPYDYELDIEFSSEAAFISKTGAGNYSLKGEGPQSGVWEESLVLPPYDPLVPKGVSNFEDLQDIDPRWPVTLELLPFNDLKGREGFLEIEVYYQSAHGEQTVWSSESEEDNGEDLGLPVDTASVTIPAHSLTGNPAGIYEVCFSHIRIESLEEVEGFDSGQKGVATLVDTLLHLHATDPNQIPGFLHLPVNDWHHGDQLGWIYGITPQWGYSHDLGWMYVAFTPRFVYQSEIGWMMPLAGTCESGLWFYTPTLGYAFTSSDMGGWYQSLSEGYGRFLGP
ncbi:MAG: hypothetical protein GVY10_08520 [Verrucomicrobia bacterium]|jgi:hypothetical protein|nr:hypothetical protein [Verrucomicrobiota bacterium]